MSYQINEIFCSLQGEGVRAGTVNVFVRFAGCNLQCSGAEVDGQLQPVCDTEFASGLKYEDPMQVWAEADRLWPPDRGGKAVIFTGGEPALQLDAALIEAFKRGGWFIAVETNGTRPLPEGIDWITVSPKTAEHTLKVKKANEVKYIRSAGMGLPRPSIAAEHFLISPHVQPEGFILPDDLAHCLTLVKENPQWRLTMQLHKLLWRVR